MRVLIAEDDNTTALLLTRVLTKAGHEVIRAHDGRSALALVHSDLSLDAILTDWMMPHMDGIEFIQNLRRSTQQPPPIVVVTQVASDDARDLVLEAGADDYLAKPVHPEELLQCVENVVFRHKQTSSDARQYHAFTLPPPSGKLPVPLVMLAAGTGGPMALQRIFRQLKSGSHAAFVVVQQGPNWMLEAFVHRLQTRTTLHVALARDGEALLPGQVRIAPAGSHCVLDERQAQLRMLDAEPANYLKPSADVLFRSAARVGTQCIAVVLSGIGCDGAMGAEVLRVTGGRVVVQEPKTAEAPSMPQTACDHGRPTAIAPVEQLAPILDGLIGGLEQQSHGV